MPDKERSSFTELNGLAVWSGGQNRRPTMGWTNNKSHKASFGKRPAKNSRQHVNVKRWMRDWQLRFGSLGVEVMVADVAQSSVVVNVAERTIILAPFLSAFRAERVLDGLYKWWRFQSKKPEAETCLLMSC
jgi:hypothetical protein